MLRLEMSDEEFRKALGEALSKKKAIKPKGKMVPTKRTPLAPDAPAPATQALIAKNGQEPTARALEAWAARVRGSPIVDVAHEMGLSIEEAKILIREVHDAIHEDLKANLDLNRQLDLTRIDHLIGAYYEPARAGDTDCANVVLKCLQQRSKLTGIEPLPDPGRSNPQNVLLFVQQSLPSINKIVDSLPLEIIPSAPGDHAGPTP
jgi:hypothetical protein